MERGVRTESLSALIDEIHRALIPASTESEIERCVCERLSESPLYESAWVGNYDAESEVVVPETAAGLTADSFEEIPLDAAPQEPLRGTVRTRAVTVERDLGEEASDRERRSDALDGDAAASAAVPLAHEEALHGVLVLSADRPGAFDARERETLSELGEDVAYGLATIERPAGTEANRTGTEWESGFVESALDDLPDVFFCFDTEGRFVRWSDELAAVTGYSGEAVAEMTPIDFFDGEDAGEVTAAIQRVFEEGRATVDASITTKDGEEIPYELTGVRIDNANGEPVGVAGIGRDITDQRLLHETIRSASEAETFEGATRAAIERVCEATDWEYGEAWTPSPDGGRMERTSAAYAASDDLAPFERASEATPMPPGVGLPGRVWSSRESHWIPDVAADETAETFPRIGTAREVGVKTSVGVPITNDGEVVATLCFYSRKRRDVDEQQIETVKSVAAELGTVLAQKRAQDEIERRRNRLDTITERITDSFYALDEDWRFTYLNEQSARVHGADSREELIGEVIWEAFPEAVGTSYYEKYHEAMETQEPVVHEDYFEPFEMWIQVRLYPSESGLSVYHKDVTERKERERKIARQHDQLTTLQDRLLETIPTGVVTFDADGELTQCNRRATEILGVSADRLGDLLPDSSEWEVVDSEGRSIPRSKLPFERVVESEEPVFDAEVGLKRPGDEPIWLLVNGTPVSNGSEEVSGVVFAFEDITERKRREQEHQRVIQALENAREGISLLDDDGEFIYVNDAYADIFGYDPEEMVGKHWETLGIENDPEYVYDEILPSVVDEGQWTGTTHCVRSDDSTFVAEHSLTHTERNELVCVVRDVSEQRRRRRDLRETKAQLEAAAEAGSVGAWTWDLREDEVFTDASLARLFGVDPDVARTGAPVELFISAIHDDDRERVERKLEEAIECCGEYEAEYRVRNGDGDVRWVVERGHVECDEGGDPVKFPGALADITERKRAEQELRKNEKQLRALIDLLPVAVFVAEKDGRIVEWNEAAKEIWGGEIAESESVADYAAYDGWWADTGEPVEPEEWALARALRGEEVTEPDVVEIEGFDGERRTVLSHGVPVRDEDGEVNRAVVTMIDITEREEREQRLQQQNERLESFASMLAHELRNPLSIAQIYLQDSKDDERAFEEVETALDRMEEMIDILLVLTRGGDTVIDPEPVALGEMATEAWSGVSAPADRLRVEADLVLDAEPHHLRHMLENLFRNALEHGDDDVTVRVGTLEGTTDGFYVEDDGTGIPESERDRIFEAGYTTDATGIGLGLTFIAQLGDAYGWEYEMTQGDEGGARFEFRNVDVADED